MRGNRNSLWAAAFSAVVLAVCAMPAAAASPEDADPAWLVSISGGVAQMPRNIPLTVDLRGPMATITLPGALQTDTGRAFAVSLARQFEGWTSDEGRRRHPWRLEVEGLVASVEREAFTAGTATARLQDHLDVQGFFLNGAVRVLRTERTHWWLYGGWGRIQASALDASSALPGCGCLKPIDTGGNTWRVKLRGEWPYGEKGEEGAALFVEGGYSPLPALRTTGVASPSTTLAESHLKTLTVGWRTRF